MSSRYNLRASTVLSSTLVNDRAVIKRALQQHFFAEIKRCVSRRAAFTHGLPTGTHAQIDAAEIAAVHAENAWIEVKTSVIQYIGRRYGEDVCHSFRIKASRVGPRMWRNYERAAQRLAEQR
jgi:hypothetical protein